MSTAQPALRWSYVTNGLGDHRIDDALELLATHGYSGVGLTLDHQHLDVFAADVDDRVAHIGKKLRELNLSVVIETGGRFVLDPHRKHYPNLLSNSGRKRRIAFLQTAVRIGAALNAEAVSFWSGKTGWNADPVHAWERLVEGINQVLDVANAEGMKLAMEPEPGMRIERVEEWEQLADDMGNPELFGLTLDIGHVHCIEDASVAECIKRAGNRLYNVQIEDMNRGIHDHLNFGDGSVNFPQALRALSDSGYAGLVSVELSRHNHTAHTVVPSSIAFLKKAEREGLTL